MQFVSWVVGSTCIALVLVAVRVRFGRTPGAPRTHLFETDGGERKNPFAFDGDDSGTAGPRCRNCRAALPAKSYHYCGGCLLAD